MKNNKIIISVIISIIVTLLIIIGIVFFIFNKKVELEAVKIEAKINSVLEFLKQSGDDDFNYEPVKCSGSNKIVCKSSLIQIKDYGESLTYTDNEIIIKPSLHSITVDISSDCDMVIENLSIKSKTNSSSEFQLMPKDNLIKFTSLGDVTFNNIDTKHNLVVYLKNDKFSEFKNVMVLAKMLDNITSEEIDMLISNTEYGITEYETNLESSNLLDDVLNIFKPMLPMEFQSKDQIIEVYKDAKERYKDMFLSGIYNANSEEMKLIDDFILNLDNVILNGYNKFGFKFIKKDDVDITTTIDKIKLEDYNITFSSEK